MRPCLLPALLMMTAAPALSDEVADTLQGAMEAYSAGDIGKTLQELAIAQQLLQGMRTGSLAGFLPPAPEGWTLEIDTEMSAGLAMMGGGTGTEATQRLEAFLGIIDLEDPPGGTAEHRQDHRDPQSGETQPCPQHGR